MSVSDWSLCKYKKPCPVHHEQWQEERLNNSGSTTRSHFTEFISILTVELNENVETICLALTNTGVRSEEQPYEGGKEMIKYTDDVAVAPLCRSGCLVYIFAR